MELFEAIANRHCYRGPFTDESISRENLTQIVQTAIFAPSGCNKQTTSFVIIDDPQLVSQIGQMHTMDAMKTAKAMIACIVDVQPESVYQNYSFQVEDCAAAVQNMLLAITALGYASVWIDGWLRIENHAQTIGQLISVPEGKVIRILLPLGKPTQTPAAREKNPLSTRAWFNKYNG